ncbi:MAG: hypothetical protein HQK51_12035 [Oligoflexia bacterium]|nr:hypothetical protein [Oligoflexia bacterium]
MKLRKFTILIISSLVVSMYTTVTMAMTPTDVPVLATGKTVKDIAEIFSSKERSSRALPSSCKNKKPELDELIKQHERIIKASAVSAKKVREKISRIDLIKAKYQRDVERVAAPKKNGKIVHPKVDSIIKKFNQMANNSKL